VIPLTHRQAARVDASFVRSAAASLRIKAAQLAAP
jgi:hypothetical protein